MTPVIKYDFFFLLKDERKKESGCRKSGASRLGRDELWQSSRVKKLKSDF